ncbi:hypothetical protein HX045_16400 [Myroides odoratimimus]|uniref:YobI family P-loop NTPase n=3 Tax=Myroides odoratimimus TaxID=76832 RepID=UPI0020972F70|nr:hypothetical protein [Myroides odoratimimus]MCO7724873.1 hypothetical protein [Myroides odoratimimus]MDM1412461.1 hypothetical protein [Myroides odoratimimus]MDM1465363.1 hypothetical protein [Myroides odoratimimus]MDM1475355.1 hypothetical protein [Myroides odoratimimus]MDM1485223.1 hypothetical protein [Myroides odoratimimus]
MKALIKLIKEKFLKLIDSTIKYLESIRYKITNKQEEKLGYTSLSPIDTKDENCHYSKALLWALEHRKKEDIKNIALTGPYGAGKSTILKTFQHNYKGKDLQFLNISLATFKDEEPRFDENDVEIKVDKTKLLRLIEISILEQIFYHEEDKKIPDSRFKKIKSYSFSNLFFLSIGYLLFIIALYNYINPHFIQSIFKDTPLHNKVCDLIHYLGIFIIIIGLFFIILKSVRIISAITINKLKIQNAEIGVGDQLNKSILNHHIDEILYFFSITPYNVIIIEDLDRFRETEIFTKLRELNLLLNNSEKTKRKEIVFLYAVRDDMFTDKERTKFFDFIIPVIPVINSSNSSEILLKKKKEFDFNISNNLIEDISFFIDDMRLLHNISNEFYLYSKKLNATLNQDKLFAIITYKNIYPNDFMKLSYNEGNLYEIFNSKNIFIKNSLNKIDDEISENKKQIIEYNKLYINNIKDLRLLYLFRVLNNLPEFQSFIINNKTTSIDEMVEDINFSYITSDNYRYNRLYAEGYRLTTRITSFSIKFSEIEKEIDQNKSYAEKEKETTELKNGRISFLKNKNNELDKQKAIIKNYKIAELLNSDNSTEIIISKNINQKLITILLRNSYIAEDYIDYISLFHEESISRSDYQFHISVKNSIKQPFNFKLSKIEKLVSKINLLDFQTEYILNYDLLDFLLTHQDENKAHLESIFDKLKDESDISIEFIKGYFETSQKLNLFIKRLCDKWNNMWGYIETSVDFTDELKTSIFKSIIDNGNIDAIVKISKQSSFTKVILSDPLFLNITENHKKLKEIIEELNILFTQIDFENSTDEMLSFIYKNQYYQINIDMMTSILKKFGEFNQVDFDNSNFFAIKNSKVEELAKYIEENINTYIESVYLKITSNVNEKEKNLIELLNHKNIDIKNKERIITQVKTKIAKLSTISNTEIYPIILKNNLLHPSWENLLHEYTNQDIGEEEDTEIEITQSTIDFINVIENAEELSKTKIPTVETTKTLYLKFWQNILQTDGINDLSYNLIIKSNPWLFNSLKFDLISDEKIISLINSNFIAPTTENFNSLKESSEGLNIYLLERKKTSYLTLLNQLEFDSSDLILILQSSLLDNSEKLTIINNCPDNVITTNSNLKLLSPILITNDNLTVNDTILSSILNNNHISVIERLKLFNKNYKKYNLGFIENYLENLGNEYAQITDKSRKARIAKNADNGQLLNILVSKGYISSFSDKDTHYRVNHKRT